MGSFRNGLLVGLGIGFILLGIVFLGLAYQVYSVRVGYGDEISEAYSLTHSTEYNALVKLLGDISTTANTTLALLSRIPYSQQLLKPLVSLMLKAGQYKQQLVEIQQATEKLSVQKLATIESLALTIGTTTTIIGIILVIAGTATEIRQRRKTH